MTKFHSGFTSQAQTLPKSHPGGFVAKEEQQRELRQHQTQALSLCFSAGCGLRTSVTNQRLMGSPCFSRRKHAHER